jgi:hypothetical protein
MYLVHAVCVCVWRGGGWSSADIMKVVQVVSKSSLMNVLEKLYTYKETQMNNQINDRDTLGYNKIFNITVHQSHPT